MEFDKYEAPQGKLYKSPDGDLVEIVIVPKGSGIISEYELVDYED